MGPEHTADQTTGRRTPRYWRSLADLARTPEFEEAAGREFPEGASELRVNSHSRRGFLKVMGASMSLAGLAGCRWPREKVLPFAHREPGHEPGIALRYATSFDLAGAVQGLLVTSYDGRPIKIEGNPLHPVNQGAADLRAQGSLLDLYDPDRSKAVVRKDGRSRFRTHWGEFSESFASRLGDLRGRGGAGLRVLADSSASPARAALRDRFLETYPAAVWHEWEPVTRDQERAGMLLAFGRALRPVPRVTEADVVVSLDADFLTDHPESVRLAREFAAGRRADDGRMNRLHVIEGVYSLTGAAADHRYPVATSTIPAVAAKLARAVLDGAPHHDPAIAAIRGAVDAAAAHPGGETFVDGVARDLLSHPGRSLIVVGPGQPAEVHALAAAMNIALGNREHTISYVVPADPFETQSPGSGGRAHHPDSLQALVDAMRAGSVDTLLLLGGNPAYDAPADVPFAESLRSVKLAVRLGLHEDETTDACFAGAESAWHLPQAHYLEAWGDVRSWDGTYSLVQPLIAPLYDGRTAIEVLALALGQAEAKGHDLTRRSAAAVLGAAGPEDLGFEPAWRKLLEEGRLAGSESPADPAGLDGSSVAAACAAARAPEGGSVEVVFRPDAKLFDGRFANNSWLQETPDPLTKLTWDNAACLSPVTAATLGVAADELLTVEVEGRELKLPAYLVPGTAPGTVAVSLGYGRAYAGKVAKGAGFNVYALRSGARPWVAPGSLRKSGGRYPLATTQDHSIIDKIGVAGEAERVPILIREATLGEYQAHPEFAQHVVHHPPLISLWKEHEYTGHKWGMAIDLSACNGCSACVVACTAENNIPVVGKQRVMQGREMHWIRIDRYFKGDPATAEVAFQPTACVQCELAPCEQVCPVAATVHDHEGINTMVYNRCIGTRYCSNNCPYKVRRFNFFNYRKGYTTTEKMVMNPEVTVRSRGVMEKCNYCLQRIEAVKIAAKNEGRAIKDGEITPACAQTCPAQAIVFGDLNDPESRVAKMQSANRAYATLAELNIKPRTEYLAKLRNPAGEQAGGSGHDAPAAGGHGGHHAG